MKFLHGFLVVVSSVTAWTVVDRSSAFGSADDAKTCADDTWRPTSLTNAPAPRAYHSVVWADHEMIVWGGRTDSRYFNTGAKYDPGTNTWATTNTLNAPKGRANHTAVWTGTEMIIWGGSYYDTSTHTLNTGARYNPRANTWTGMTTTGAPSARENHTAIWTGQEMIVWGGSKLNTGGRYRPIENAWRPTNTLGAPSVRSNHTAVWTGSEMIVWGGTGGSPSSSSYLNSGGRYCAKTSCGNPPCDPNLALPVDRLDAFPATRTPGNLFPNCSFTPTDPNQFHSAIDCPGATDFCRLGGYYLIFAYESLANYKALWPWARFIPGPGCGPNKNCEWRVEGCGPDVCDGSN